MTRTEARNELNGMRCTEWFSPKRTQALDEAIVSMGILDRLEKVIDIKKVLEEAKEHD